MHTYHTCMYEARPRRTGEGLPSHLRNCRGAGPSALATHTPRGMRAYRGARPVSALAGSLCVESPPSSSSLESTSDGFPPTLPGAATAVDVPAPRRRRWVKRAGALVSSTSRNAWLRAAVWSHKKIAEGQDTHFIILRRVSGGTDAKRRWISESSRPNPPAPGL